MSGAEGFAPGAKYFARGEQIHKQTELTRSTERGSERRHTYKKVGALALTALLAHGLHTYQSNVDEEKERLAHTYASVSEYSSIPFSEPDTAIVPRGAYETLNPAEQSYARNIEFAAHTAIIDVSGFGKTENDDSRYFMGGLSELGAGWTLHYDRKGIDFDGIAKMLIEKARTDPRGINRLAFYGDSMGTIVATKLAAKVARLAPDIAIPFIILDSPAVNLDVLRDQSKSDGTAMLTLMHYIPESEYSPDLRVFGEMWLRRQEVLNNPLSLPGLYSQVHHQVFDNAYLSANLLLKKQLQIIIDSDVQGDLKYLGSLDPGRQPDIFMTGAAEAHLDDVVNTPKAYEYLKKWTGEADLPFHRLSGIEDFQHGRQAYSERSREEYASIFKKEVVPVVLRAEGIDVQTGLD